MSDAATRVGGTVGFCVSEHLASRVIACWLAEQGVEVHGFLADIGQCSREQLDRCAAELTASGVPTEVVDLRGDMAELLLDVVRCGARYDGGYWNTTGASRAVLVRGLSRVIAARGLDVLGHASVSGGNDERRFRRYTEALAPELGVLSAWSDPACAGAFMSRAGMVAFAEAHGLGVAGDEAVRSIDANLGGVSHEGTDLEDLTEPGTATMTPLMTCGLAEAPDAPGAISVRIEDGRPVAVDGTEVTALELMQRANEAAGRHGVGRLDVIENRLNGTKCRGVYEAPGLELLGACARRVQQATLTPEVAQLVAVLSGTLGQELYAGRWFSPAANAARHAMAEALAGVTGTVGAGLYKGNVVFESLADVPTDSAAPRQGRFAAGGMRWNVLDATEREETSGV